METNIEILPFFSDSYKFTYTASIERTNRIFNFYWNERCSCWYMDVLQEDSTPILLGIRLVANYPIAADYSLQNSGLTGYFLIIPRGEKNPQSIFDSYTSLAEQYILSYIYITEDS
jgi:hypothetical protein